MTIEVYDVPLKLVGKAPRKPLDLLKALLTSRHGLDAGAAMDLLWPELEGDAARNAFDIAVHRLRKLLQCNEAVLAVQGQLMLNPDKVWVDVFELARLSELDCSDQEVPELGKRALELYQGPFLRGDSATWVVDARDQQRHMFLRMSRKITDILAARGEWNTIRHFCDKAIRLEPGDAALYRAWIRSLAALGLEEEAKLAYRQYEALPTATRVRPTLFT
jgi:two-component SAPR family response regulator